MYLWRHLKLYHNSNVKLQCNICERTFVNWIYIYILEVDQDTLDALEVDEGEFYISELGQAASEVEQSESNFFQATLDICDRTFANVMSL